MSKVLVSFLGTGISNSHRYEAVRYSIGDKEYRTTLIAEAIAEHYDIHKFIFIGTVRSMWEEVYDKFSHRNGSKINDEYLDDLLDFVDDAKIDTDVSKFPNVAEIQNAIGGDSRVIVVDYGINQDQLKSNTEKIISIEDCLDENDELIVDVTHGFRSLPIAMMNLLVYLKNVSNKNITISHVLYGMREIENEQSSKIGKAKGVVPIVDLNEGAMGIMGINDWIIGAYDFKNYGNGYQIGQLIKDSYSELSEKLNNLSDIKNLNYLGEIQGATVRFINYYNENCCKLSMVQRLALEPVVQDLKRYKLNETQSLFKYQLNIARWQFAQHNYLASYITLTESMVSYVCTKSDPQLNPLDYDDRELAKSKLKDESFPNQQLCGLHKNINGIRNSLAHNTQGHNKLDYKKINNRIENKIQGQLKNFINTAINIYNS